MGINHRIVDEKIIHQPLYILEKYPHVHGILWDIFMFLPSSKWVYKPALPSSGIRLTDRVGWSRNNGITFIHERKIMSYTDGSGWKGMTCKQHDPTEFVEGNVNRACIFLQKFTINPSICGLLFIINPLLFIFGMQRVSRQGLWISLTGVLFTNAMQQSLWVCFGISVFIGL